MRLRTVSPTITYSILGIIGLATLLLGFISLSRTISGPARLANEERREIAERLQAAQIIEDEVLRVQDTDQDGLTDYEELSVYGTSAYLADSDSDGYSDKQEIDSGNDPNCPAGQSCRTFQTETGAQLETTPAGFEELLEAQAEITINEAGEPDLANLTSAQIRQLLLESGQVSAEQLQQVDDETLLGIYAEVIGGSQEL